MSRMRMTITAKVVGTAQAQLLLQHSQIPSPRDYCGGRAKEINTYKYQMPFLTSGKPSSGKFCPKNPVMKVRGKKIMVTAVSCPILWF